MSSNQLVPRRRSDSQRPESLPAQSSRDSDNSRSSAAISEDSTIHVPAPSTDIRSSQESQTKVRRSTLQTMLNAFKSSSPPKPKKTKVSTPYDPVHLTHVGFNSSSGEFTGLPKEWQQLLQDSGLSRVNQERNPEAVMEIVRFYQEAIAGGSSGLSLQFPLETPPPPPPSSLSTRPAPEAPRAPEGTTPIPSARVEKVNNVNTTTRVPPSLPPPSRGPLRPPVPRPTAELPPPLKPAPKPSQNSNSGFDVTGQHKKPSMTHTSSSTHPSQPPVSAKQREAQLEYYQHPQQLSRDYSYPTPAQHDDDDEKQITPRPLPPIPPRSLRPRSSGSHSPEPPPRFPDHLFKEPVYEPSLDSFVSATEERFTDDYFGTQAEDFELDESTQTKEVLARLSEVLRTKDKRNLLQSLNGDRAQQLIDFLYFLMSQPTQLPDPWMRKHTLLALRKLCENSLLYPRCYVLKDIEYDPTAPAACGGFCDIFKVRHNAENVCLKVVRLYQTSDVTKVLRVCTREAILWGQLQHPNIVPFYGVYYLNDSYHRICLVSPWMEDGNIASYLQMNPQAPRQPLIYDIILGLEYLHNENIVHGDLKGMNVLVNSAGRACITDFGLSSIWTDKTLGFTATTVGVSGRTDRWAAPELFREDGARPTRASDVWAFGCVCYEIITRLLPFHECAMNIQILRKLIDGKLPARKDDPAITNPLDKVGQDMWNLMMRCWSSEPEERPTCRQIRELLNMIPGCVRYGDALTESTHLRNVMQDVSTLDTVSVCRILEAL